LTVNGHARREFRSGQSSQRWQDVAGIDQVVAFATTRHQRRTIHYERHVNAVFGQRVNSFSGNPSVDATTETLKCLLVGSVVCAIVNRDSS
jgi:hypothetical protein